MIFVHDSHSVLEVQDVNCMVSDTDALGVLKHLPCCHLCVKGILLAQIGIPRLIKFIDEEALCYPLRCLKCVLVGDVGAMYGFGFGADRTGCAVGDRYVVYC